MRTQLNTRKKGKANRMGADWRSLKSGSLDLPRRDDEHGGVGVGPLFSHCPPSFSASSVVGAREMGIGKWEAVAFLALWHLVELATRLGLVLWPVRLLWRREWGEWGALEGPCP